jgi:hypothetical protein
MSIETATTSRTPRQQLNACLDRYTDEVAAAMRKALRHLRQRVPGATELVYDNYNALAVGFGPGDRASEVVLSLAAYPRWVTLFFLQGAGLPDPRKLLKGSGTRVRHIVLTGSAVLASADVDALIGAALRSAKVAIDPARKPALIIKSISARQRPRRPAKAVAPAKAPTPAKGKASRQGGVDYATVRELALALPDVIDSSTLRGIGFKVRGKLLACKAIHRSAEPETLMVRVGATDRDRLIAADAAVFYLTPHYLVNASVLVRLQHVSRKTLQAVLALGCQFVSAESAAGSRKPAKRKKAASVFRYL